MIDLEIHSPKREGWKAFMSQQVEGFHKAPGDPPNTPERKEWEDGWSQASESSGNPLCGLLMPPRLYQCAICGAIYPETQMFHCQTSNI